MANWKDDFAGDLSEIAVGELTLRIERYQSPVKGSEWQAFCSPFWPGGRTLDADAAAGGSNRAAKTEALDRLVHKLYALAETAVALKGNR